MYVARHKNKFIKSAQTPQGRIPTMIDFQNQIVEMYVRREGEEEGRENGRGRRFIRWTFDKRLRANQTKAVMEKLRQNIHNAFYIRYNYAYVLVNNETGLRMVFYKQQKGSPWINNFAEAEIWVNEQENNRLTLDNIERPNTKWTFIKFSNIEVKAVIDNQPMLGTGPLPDWLRNLAHGRKMVSLDTYRDEMCLWRCIAVYITKLAKTYVCNDCGGNFTQAGSLQRHTKTCRKGETEIICLEEKLIAPLSKYEMTFYDKTKISKTAIEWLEKTAKQLKIHIHHGMCGHGGERHILGAPVDGFHLNTGTVFQFHGCWWHGCPRCFGDRGREIRNGKTRDELYAATIVRTEALRKAGYRVIEKWQCQYEKTNERCLKKQTKSYPYAIFYDFESLHDTTKRKEPTSDLTYEAAHVPISVSIGDTLDREPTHICDPDPKKLINRFMKELERRAENIREAVRREIMSKDNYFNSTQRRKLIEWWQQVPVLRFNSGRYDLNLIKEHFTELLADTTNKVFVAKKANTTMFLKTEKFLFLDIINYLGPGTSYDAWVKAYGCSAQKSWLPYEWLDSPEKLNYPGLPDYPAWYSKLKEGFVLKLSEFMECKKIFKEKGMQTFADWLCYYNNLDVAPGLEALEKMRAFYTEKGIDAVSLPGVSLHYLLRGTIDRGAELWTPSKEAYEMLKGAMVGGPSIVFKRFHEAGVTQIRPHRFKKAKKCHRIIGYDANALYLSTMLRDMPGGKGEVVNYTGQEGLERIRDNKWFRFAEVDIEIPQKLWMKFEEMPPFFFTRQIPEQAVPQHMKDYMERTGRKRGDGKKLVGALSAKKLLLYEPLLRWYVNHGAVITAVYRTIDYKPTKGLKWFVDEVTDARRTGDVDKSKALLADIFKLLGNSSYGKMIEAVERHTSTIYTKDEKLVDRNLRSAFFEDLDEIGGAYELESRKARVHIKRSFQIGIAVYQLAKQRMLEFYYDFVDKYVDRRDFELIQMDTDSNYMAISGEKLEDIIRPELREEFEATKKQWLAWDKWSGRTPGLFKLESEGSGMIALCSKCYFAKGEKNKFSTKGMSKKQNEITWQRFKAALNGSIDRAENRGFRMVGNHMMTYEQHKLGLSAYYDKRWVLPDGIHTEPIEFHIGSN